MKVEKVCASSVSNMAEEDGENGVKKALEQCAMVQLMIDISAEHLNGLRTICATSAELTQQEIRTLEGKLIKLFSRQLVAKARLQEKEQPLELKQYPRLEQWLSVVGLGVTSVQGICKRVGSLEEMLKMTDHEIKLNLPDNGSKEEEERRLISALQNLQKYTEYLRLGEKALGNELDLHWDSWDQGLPNSGGASPKPPRLRTARSSVPSEELIKSNPSSPLVTSSNPVPPWSPANSPAIAVFGNYIVPPPPQVNRDRKYTPPPTPPTSTKKGEKIKFPTTPPPRKKHQTAVTNLLPDSYPLTKSKSHESQLATRVDVPEARFESQPRRQRLLTEPGLENDQDELAPLTTSGHSSSLTNSPMRMSPHPYIEQHVGDDSNNRSPIVCPTSPRTPTMTPQKVPTNVEHRFAAAIKISNCDACKKQMIIGFKCKNCKLRCHRDCLDKLPIQLSKCDLNQIWRLQNDGNHSPIMTRNAILSPPSHKKDGSRDHRRPGNQQLPNFQFQGADTCSNASSSSCNSSAPPSPAIINSLPHTPPLKQPRLFNFAEVEKDITPETRPLTENSDMVETQKSNDSDKTMSGTSGSTDSEKTLAGRVDSQDSQISDVDSVDRSWPRQNSLSFREWEIPYVELHLDEIVGFGRFGTVWKGNWHGEVAIKVFNMDTDDVNILDAFKQEVSTFRKTRHENLILFMGACMKPPDLAIVTRLCKGMTLYSHIHGRRDRFNLNRSIIIAQQISQGMSYLHARGIVHKDLKTKNIFLENGKVVITDFGLFSLTKLCQGNRKGNWLTIPPGWLCYLSPEIVCRLRASNHFQENYNIAFTTASDVYAFGTVWYELLCGEWPFKGQPPEAIIWQVGKGMKQSLGSVQASRDVKEILMLCWSYKGHERPDFGKLFQLLDKLPKKRLARSPSHPIHLSRSAESVF